MTSREHILSQIRDSWRQSVDMPDLSTINPVKYQDRIEKFSVLRAHMAVERADVCLIMIDAAEGITWRHNSTQYEEDTGFYHHEWYWEVI